MQIYHTFTCRVCGREQTIRTVGPLAGSAVPGPLGRVG